MDLRDATAGETAVTLAAAAVGLGGTVFAALSWLDWGAGPGLALVALLVMLAGDAAVGGVSGAPRPALVQIARLSELPGSTRRALRRDLWAGRPGPPEVRRHAVGWTDRALRAPGLTGFWVFLAGFNLAAVQHADLLRSGAAGAAGLATVLLCLLAGVAHEVRRRRALQLATGALASGHLRADHTVDLYATDPMPRP